MRSRFSMEKGAGRALRAFALMACLATTACPAPASASMFTYGNPAFCAPKKPVRDFGLSKLPPVREVPESAKPLGHGAVTMYGGWSRVMPEPQPFGYGFSEHNYGGDGVRLDWTITAQLWTVDKRGTPFREIDHEELFIGHLSALRQPHIDVDPPKGRRGFYRFSMQIADRSGKVIGAYGAYFRVVRPSWRPKLRLTREVLRPGERLLIRIENYGSKSVSYAEPFGVQRFENGGWVPVPDLLRARWRMWLGLLGAGGTGKCNVLSLPPDMPFGSYRIVKRVGTELGPRGRQVQLTAPFVVAEPDSDVDIEY